MIHRVTAREYIADPTRASSLAYWKNERMTLPEGMAVVRDDEFDPARYAGYADRLYFRLCRSLEGVKAPVLPAGFEEVKPTFADFVKHIRSCYWGAPTEDEFEEYRSHPVYDPTLWVAVRDQSGLVATAIAELDREIGELSLEWVQVSDGYRRKGLGRYLVERILYLAKDKASFATVSGAVDNPSDPRALYQVCGFGHEVVWHVVTKEETHERTV